MFNSSHKRGFTLIEMLVVIAIIVLLASLLVPVAKSTMNTSKNVRCMSNLRQMSQTVSAHFIGGSKMPAGGFEMMDLLLKELPGQVRFCPFAPPPNPGVTSQVGGAYRAWVWNGIAGSYGFNRHFYYTDATYSTSFLDPKLAPTSAPLFADAAWIDGDPHHNNSPPVDYQFPGLSSRLGRFCIDRHDFAVNVAFLDGKVEKVPLPKLWNLQWSTRFQVNKYPDGHPGVTPN